MDHNTYNCCFYSIAVIGSTTSIGLFLHSFMVAGIAIANFGLNKEVWYTSNSKSGKGKVVRLRAMEKGGLAPLILNLNVGISGQLKKPVALRDIPASI